MNWILQLGKITSNNDHFSFKFGKPEKGYK